MTTFSQLVIELLSKTAFSKNKYYPNTYILFDSNSKEVANLFNYINDECLIKNYEPNDNGVYSQSTGNDIFYVGKTNKTMENRQSDHFFEFVCDLPLLFLGEKGRWGRKSLRYLNILSENKKIEINMISDDSTQESTIIKEAASKHYLSNSVYLPKSYHTDRENDFYNRAIQFINPIIDMFGFMKIDVPEIPAHRARNNDFFRFVEKH